jgi:hypothetical protein
VEEQYDMELVLRFVVFRTMPTNALTNLGDLGEFLTEKAKALAQDGNFNYKAEETAFKETFETLSAVLGDDAFRRYDKLRGRFVGGFSVSAFEAVAIGLGYSSKKAKAKPELVKQRVEDMWSNLTFVNNSGSGIRASSRVPKIIPFGRTTFSK